MNGSRRKGFYEQVFSCMLNTRFDFPRVDWEDLRTHALFEDLDYLYYLFQYFNKGLKKKKSVGLFEPRQAEMWLCRLHNPDEWHTAEGSAADDSSQTSANVSIAMI